MFHISNELRIIFNKYLESKDESVLRLHLILLVRDVVKKDIEEEYKSYMLKQNKSKSQLEIESEEENNLLNDEKFYFHVNNVKNGKIFSKITNLVSTIGNEVKDNFGKRNNKCILKLEHSVTLPSFKEINQILINICSNKIHINRRKDAIKKLLKLDALTIVYCEQFKIFMTSINEIFQEKLLQESLLKCFTWICNSEEFHLIYNSTVFLLNEVQTNNEWWSNPRNSNIVLFHKLLSSLLINVPEVWKFFKQYKVEKICHLFKEYYKLWLNNSVLLFIYAYLDNKTSIWKRFLSTSIFWKTVNMEEEEKFFEKFLLSEENLNINDFCFLIKSQTIQQNIIKNMIKNYKFSIINIYKSLKISEENNE